MPERSRDQSLVGNAFRPGYAEVQRSVGKNELVKREDLRGVEGILSENMHSFALSVKGVVCSRNSVLIYGVGGQTCKFNGYLLARGYCLLVKYSLAVVDYSEELFFLLTYKRNGIVYLNDEIQIVKARYHIGKMCYGLIFGINADLYGTVTLHTHVLDLGAVNVLYGVNGVLGHTRHAADVAFQHQIFKVRAFLKHIRGILLSVKSKGKYLHAIGIVYVYRDIYVLVFFGVIYLLAARLRDYCFLYRSLYSARRLKIAKRVVDVYSRSLAEAERSYGAVVLRSGGRGGSLLGYGHTLIDRHLSTVRGKIGILYYGRVVAKQHKRSDSRACQQAYRQYRRYRDDHVFFGKRAALSVRKLVAFRAVSFNNILVDARYDIELCVISVIIHSGSPPQRIFL